ncbi:hypothetical protein [Acinetobacter bereziniae]|nr:hypothetical protein [Acinetobacter bereziniae]
MNLKSKVSPTQNNLNFRAKAWQCKLYIIEQYIHRFNFIDQQK